MTITNDKLVFVFKNFFRNRFINLTAKSIKHFAPNSEIHVCSLYKNSQDEYDAQEPTPYPTFYRQTKHHSFGSIVGNPINNAIFSEGYNLIFEEFRHIDGVIVMLAEDHFFTSGQTIKELACDNYDLAIAPWRDEMNGSIIGVRPKALQTIFPVAEDTTYPVERSLKLNLMNKVDPSKTHRLSTRECLNYGGDGFYTNSADEIEAALKEIGII